MSKKESQEMLPGDAIFSAIFTSDFSVDFSADCLADFSRWISDFRGGFLSLRRHIFGGFFIVWRAFYRSVSAILKPPR